MLALIGLAVALARDRAVRRRVRRLESAARGPVRRRRAQRRADDGARSRSAPARGTAGGSVSPAPAWAASIAIKWVSLVFLPLRAVEAYRQGRKVGHLGFAVAAGLIVAVAFWRYGPDWLESFGNFSGQLRRTTSVSTARWLMGARPVRRRCGDDPDRGLRGGLLWLLREAWRGRARLALCACFLLLTASWLVPWYAVWAVPLAAIERDRRRSWCRSGSAPTSCARPYPCRFHGDERADHRCRGATARPRAREAAGRRSAFRSSGPTAVCWRSRRSDVCDLPPFASSAMDGFAVRVCRHRGRRGPRRGRPHRRGKPADAALSAGQAMAISTGGVVPEGADAVVPLERVAERDGRIELSGRLLARRRTSGVVVAM